MKNKITYFNRHESMNSETRSIILDIINDLYECPLGHSTFTIQNWLYGSFDGYDYSSVAIESNELNSVRNVDSELAEKILHVFNMIEKYERTNEPNSNQF
jgi:hypothetical protein